jgi:Helix-turn-helix
MAKFAADAATAARRTPPLEAVAKDEERREKAKGDLVRALQSYINKLDNAKERDVNRETEIVCDYARENYASRAAAGLLSQQSTDLEALFGIADLNMRGDLNGLETFGDVLDLVKRLKFKRPPHWPDSGAIRPGDPAKMREAAHAMVRGLEVSFDWLLDEPWSNWFRPQMRKCIKECVDAARTQYEEQLSSRLQTHGDLKPNTGRKPKRDATKAADRQSFIRPHIAPTPRKLTRNGLAEEIQIEQSSLSRWYHGRQRLSTENIGKLAEYLKVKSDAIPK